MNVNTILPINPRLAIKKTASHRFGAITDSPDPKICNEKAKAKLNAYKKLSEAIMGFSNDELYSHRGMIDGSTLVTGHQQEQAQSRHQQALIQAALTMTQYGGKYNDVYAQRISKQIVLATQAILGSLATSQRKSYQGSMTTSDLNEPVQAILDITEQTKNTKDFFPHPQLNAKKLQQELIIALSQSHNAHFHRIAESASLPLYVAEVKANDPTSKTGGWIPLSLQHHLDPFQASLSS